MKRSEWRVCSQTFGVGCEMVYQVYRLRDITVSDYEGNREYALKNWSFSKKAAEDVCKKLNGGV